MAQTVELSITCPRCNTEFEANGYTLIDAGDEADAEALWQVQNASFNTAQCPNCGAAGLIPIPLLFHDPEAQLLLCFVPGAEQYSEEQITQLIGPLLQEFIDSMPADDEQFEYLFHPIVTDDPAALVAAARGEVVTGDDGELYIEEEEGEEGDEEGEELSPEEQLAVNQRVQLLQSLFEAEDSIQRITLLRDNRAMVDDLFEEMMETVLYQAQANQPEMVPELTKFRNEIQVFRASNP